MSFTFRSWMPPKLLVLAITLAACGPSAPAKPTIAGVRKPAAARPQTWRLTLVSATVDGTQSDQRPWDDGKKAKADAPVVGGPVDVWRHAHPELDGADELLGEPILLPGLLDDARKSTAADPMVLVSIRDQVFRSPLIAGSFQPVWNFPFLVDLVATSETPVHLTVVDWDGASQYDVIGDLVIPASQLLGGVTELPRFGNVARLTLTATAERPAVAEKRLALPAHPSWTDTGLDVVAGQEVTIDAAGEVCTAGGDVNKCAGPEGQASTSGYNLPGFKHLRHGALVGALGDTRFHVGRALRFVAGASGRLYLGVNDRDDGNNQGSFDARVRVQ